MTNKSNIVICGFPRSGTSLLYSLLLNTVKSHELPHAETSYTDLKGRFSRQGACPALTKKPMDILKAASSEIPIETPLIIVIRDPRDVLLSKHPKLTKQGIDDFFIHADLRYRFDSEGRACLGKPGLLDYCTAIKQVIEQRAAIGNFVLCHYEDLIKAPDALQEALKKVGIEYRTNALFSDWNKQDNSQRINSNHHPQISEALNGIRAIDPQNLGKWAQPKNIERIAEQFTRFPTLQTWLETFGYEKNCSWMRNLTTANNENWRAEI